MPEALVMIVKTSFSQRMSFSVYVREEPPREDADHATRRK